MLNVRNYGAVGDGVADDTVSIQQALNEAGECRGTVYLPEGTYRCGTLHMCSETGLVGDPVWTYKRNGGSILQLSQEHSSCLLDITDSIGITLNGVCFDGGTLGEGIHGIMADHAKHCSEENSLRMERCRVSKFTGHGVFLRHYWVFSLRSNQLIGNFGDGLCCDNMWDGFLLDNWFSANRRAGVRLDWGAACTMTGNRVEWNRESGILILGCHNVNMANNYLDRIGGPGIEVRLHEPNFRAHSISVTGNIFNRCGAPNWGELAATRSCQLLLEEVDGLACTGNCLHVGTDDGGGGSLSPRYGIVYRSLQGAVIANNSLHQGALEHTLLDLGGHGDEVLIAQNVGTVYQSG